MMGPLPPSMRNIPVASEAGRVPEMTDGDLLAQGLALLEVQVSKASRLADLLSGPPRMGQVASDRPAETMGGFISDAARTLDRLNADLGFSVASIERALPAGFRGPKDANDRPAFLRRDQYSDKWRPETEQEWLARKRQEDQVTLDRSFAQAQRPQPGPGEYENSAPSGIPPAAPKVAI